MSDKLVVNVDSFEPRWYQTAVINAMEKDGFKRVLIVYPRRAGKDVMGLNILLRQAFKRVGVYYYLYPEIGQGRRAIWESVLIDGRQFIDFIPKELIKGKSNKSMLRIPLINGSSIQFLGTNKIEGLLSANPMGVVYSEFAYTNHPLAWAKVSPMLAGNKGFAVFVSTPNGHDGLFWNLYETGKTDPEWYVKKLTVEDTKHIDAKELAQEKKQMSEEMFEQEYMCSFDAGIHGAYYARAFARALSEGRIGTVPHDSSKPVSTFWDIGVDDCTSIIFAQFYENRINIIDYYENSNEGSAHYVSVVRSKNYIYSTHVAPHDVAVREWGNEAKPRIVSVAELGLNFISCPKPHSLSEGIEQVRLTFSRLWIDKEKCSQLIACIENYTKKWNSVTKRYSDAPKRNFATHGASALMYMCLSLDMLTEGTTAEELQQIFRQNIYGTEPDHGPMYRNPNSY